MPRPPRLDHALARLRAAADPAHREGLARFGIPPDRALGVPTPAVRALAKEVGRDHALAEALWDTGILEARLLATLIDDPAQVTPVQMEAWVLDLADWATCDALSFALLDRTPYAVEKARAWMARDEEYVRRAGLVLVAGLAVHDKKRSDADFVALLGPVCAAADDDRKLVRKAASWALRSIGKRNEALRKAALAGAERLRASESRGARWTGGDAARELRSAAVIERLAARAAAAAARRPPRSRW